MLLTARTRSHRRHVRPGRKKLDRIDGEEGQLSKNSCRKPFVDIYRQAKHDTFLCRVCKLQSSIKGAAVATCTKQMMNSSWPSMGRGISQRRHNEPRVRESHSPHIFGRKLHRRVREPVTTVSGIFLAPFGRLRSSPTKIRGSGATCTLRHPPPPWSSQTAEVWRSLHCGTDRAPVFRDTRSLPTTGNRTPTG